jgi:hypothetical protein
MYSFQTFCRNGTSIEDSAGLLRRLIRVFHPIASPSGFLGSKRRSGKEPTQAGALGQLLVPIWCRRLHSTPAKPKRRIPDGVIDRSAARIAAVSDGVAFINCCDGIIGEAVGKAARR